MQAHTHMFRALFFPAAALLVATLTLAATQATGVPVAQASVPRDQAAVSSSEPVTGTAKAIDDMLQRMHKADKFDGVVLVADKDGILLQQAYGTANFEWEVPHTPDSVFRIMYVTKLFTALAVLQLVEQSKLSLDDSICQYVDPCPEAWQLVTIHHLLNHTSGIADSLDFHGIDWPRAHVTNEKLFAQSAKAEMKYAPGTSLFYCNTCYLLLGEVIRSASGKGYMTYINDNILKPAGLKSTGFDDGTRVIRHRANEYDSDLYVAAPYDIANLGVAGAMYSTAEDLYRFDRALYGGELISTTLLAGTWDKDSTALVSTRSRRQESARRVRERRRRDLWLVCQGRSWASAAGHRNGLFQPPRYI